MIAPRRLSLGLLLAVFPLPAFAQPERKLADWMKDLESTHPLVREEAIEMVGMFAVENKEVIPKIEALLKDPLPMIRVRSSVVLLRLGSKPGPLVPILVDAARKCGTAERLVALEYAVEHGRPDDGSAALLGELVLDRDVRVRFQFEKRLLEVGDKAAPVLLRLVENPDREIVQWMLRLIERMRVDAAILEPHLKPLLKDRLTGIRGLAAGCLIRANIDIEPLLPALKELLADKDYEARRSVLYALCEVGAKHKGLVPAFEAILKDAVPAMRVRAAAALWEFDGRTKETIPILISCLPSNTESAARMYAEQAIQKMSPAAAELIGPYMEVLRKEPPNYSILHHFQTFGRLGAKAVEPLLQYGDDGDQRFRELVATSLGRIGETAMPHLLKEFPNATGIKRTTIIRAFVQMGPSAESAATVLIEAFAKGTPDEQRDIVHALTNMGPGAKAALPKIIEIMKDPKLPRVYLVQVIGAIGPWAGPALPTLIDILKDKSVTVNERVTIAMMLGSLGKSAAEAIPFLIELCKNDAGTFRAQILQSAFAIDPKNKDVHQAIVELCKDGTQNRYVVTMISRMVSFGETLKPILPAMIESQKAQVPPPMSFIQSLGQIDYPDPAVVDYLKVMVDYRDADISSQAALALAKLGIFDEKNLDRLTQIISNRGDPLRHYVFQEVVKHGVKARPLASALVRAWQQEENPAYRMPLAEALTRVDAASAKSLTEWLKEFTKRPEAYHAVHAAMALWRIDSAYDPLPVLRRVIKTPIINGHLAVIALGELGPAGKNAIPDLQALLKNKSDDYTLKGPAIIALLKIDPAQAQALKPAVEELFKDRDPRWMTQRQNVSQYLGELGEAAKPLVPMLVEGWRRAVVYEHVVYLKAIRKIDPDAIKTPND